jgi:hypothetical protein
MPFAFAAPRPKVPPVFCPAVPSNSIVSKSQPLAAAEAPTATNAKTAQSPNPQSLPNFFKIPASQNEPDQA